jgi:hypothetical protein
LSEAFQLASTGGCATGLRTRPRHACDFHGSRLDHLAQGLPQILSARSPRATGLASSLSGCIRLTVQRCSFQHRRRSGRFCFTGLAWAACPSRRACSLCPGFRRLSFGRLNSRSTARVTRSVLMHSSNRLPSG